MNNVQEQIAALEQQIKFLRSKQLQFGVELDGLQSELNRLKGVMGVDLTENESLQPVSKPGDFPKTPITEKRAASLVSNRKLENFIGTNLTSKIGILITLVGIFIGAKYAIDKELVSPLLRIVFGYLSGGALVIIAIRLKKSYENFSAVLIGGGLAVIYFITYISHSFYQLFPQAAAFILMICITGAAVKIALWYNQKIIALLGQVASYAIPFLLSDGSGRITILFTYISIINIGICYLSFKKDWKLLYRIAFVLTWSIYIVWSVTGQPEARQFFPGIAFLLINFFTFFIAFLSYKIIRNELYQIGEIGLLLLNALVFFFVGCDLINTNYSGSHFLTYFTLANAVIHFATAAIISRLNLNDKSVRQFLTGLGLMFITIAVPMELNGSWVTLLWALEASILCWIGITNERTLYLRLTAIMIFVALTSLLQDWILNYRAFGNFLLDAPERQPFFNMNFMLSLVASACFGFIHSKTFRSSISADIWFTRFYNYSMPLIFWLVVYFTFFNEIHFLWDKKIDYHFTIKNQPEKYFKYISLLVYTLLFFAALFKLNHRKVKNRSVDERLLIGSIFLCIIFLAGGLRDVGNLRDIYLNRAKLLHPSIWLLAVRYVLFSAVAIFYFQVWQAVKRIATPNAFRIFSYVFNIILLSIICNEFIHWMDLAGYQNQYKLGLSVICALYALVLIFAGITWRKKHLRIGAIILFATTLLKLFFYDLASLSTISKTIVLVLLGAILLIISFLYNKYKDVILGED